VTDVNTVLTHMDGLNTAINRRLQIEDAFIQAMVTEFTAIRNDLTTCNQNLATANRDKDAANSARDAANSARDAARAAQTGLPAAQTGSPVVLDPIIDRLNIAIQQLQTAAPLSENNLDPMIDTVVGTNPDGTSKRRGPNPFLNRGSPPDGSYPYMNAPLPSVNPSARNASSSPQASWASYLPSLPWGSSSKPVSSPSGLSRRPAASAAPAPLFRPDGSPNAVTGSAASQSPAARNRSDSINSDENDDELLRGFSVAGKLGGRNPSRSNSIGGWRTRRRRSKRTKRTKRRKP